MNKPRIQKIAFLIFSISHAGGCERITCGLATELSRRGYKVSIINIYNANQSFFPLPESVPVKGLYRKATAPSKYHFPFVPLRLLSLLRKKKNRPDLLIGVGTDMAMYALPSLALYGIKMISWEHFNFTIQSNVFLAGFGRQLSARFAKAIVVLTNKDKQLFETHLPVRGKVVCIPNFMTFHAPAAAPLQSHLAMAAGRFTYQKGFDNLIKIWASVAGKHPQWKLKIIGKGEDEPLLKTLIADYELHDSISLEPLSDNMAEHYTKASLFLLTSRWEGLPMVTVEAKSFGLPIVSFDCDTGPRDIINGGTDGLLVPDGNNELFAQTLDSLLNNRQKLQEMGRNARADSKRYAPETVLPLWEHLFSTLF